MVYSAFTLSEVLITLVVIGIIAAITIPVLTGMYKRQVIETSLEKFYSTMNQAMLRSSIENGPYNTWQYAEENTSDSMMKFWDTYFKNYVNVLKIEKRTDGYIDVYFTDGTAARIGWHGKDWHFCPKANDINNSKELTTSCFLFAFYPTLSSNNSYCVKNFNNKGLEPYVSCDSVKQKEDLYKEKTYAAKLIQINGWKIPKDYPWRL